MMPQVEDTDAAVAYPQRNDIPGGVIGPGFEGSAVLRRREDQMALEVVCGIIWNPRRKR